MKFFPAHSSLGQMKIVAVLLNKLQIVYREVHTVIWIFFIKNNALKRWEKKWFPSICIIKFLQVISLVGLWCCVAVVRSSNTLATRQQHPATRHCRVQNQAIQCLIQQPGWQRATTSHIYQSNVQEQREANSCDITQGSRSLLALQRERAYVISNFLHYIYKIPKTYTVRAGARFST